MSPMASKSSYKKHRVFQPLVIIALGPEVLPQAKHYLIDKLKTRHDKKGAELIVKAEKVYYNEETVLYIGCTIHRLLVEAEAMKMKKTYNDGSLKDLLLKDIDNYLDSDDLDSFLTSAEKQSVVLRNIEGLQALEGEYHIPGYPNLILQPGQQIITKYINGELIANFFPLHDQERVKVIENEWLTNVNQPLDMIHEYFGVRIALYFSFLGRYTVSLLPTAFFGIFIHFISPSKTMYRESTFAVFNMVWSTIFLEGWKRHCNAVCYKWGTISNSMHSNSIQEPRPEYYGTLGINPVTRRKEYVYPDWKRVMKYFLVSVPVIIFSLTIGLFAMLGFFSFRKWWLLMNYPKNIVLALIPAIGYNGVILSVLKSVYDQVALKLNMFENHRLQSTFDNHLVLKLILFEFCNKFMSLFYVAFCLQDRELLKELLGVSVFLRYMSVGTLLELITFTFIKLRKSRIVLALGESLQDVTRPDLDWRILIWILSYFAMISNFFTDSFRVVRLFLTALAGQMASNVTRRVEPDVTDSVQREDSTASSRSQRAVTGERQVDDENVNLILRISNFFVNAWNVVQNLQSLLAPMAAWNRETQFEQPSSPVEIEEDHKVDIKFRKQAAVEGELERHPCYLFDVNKIPTRDMHQKVFSLRQKLPSNEYLNVLIQFCYIYLFSSVRPFAAVFGVITNILEIRFEALKYCRGFQRPFAESVNSIGIWQSAFEVIGLISVITNCALIALDPEVQKLLPSNISAVNMVLIFVACEHLVLAIKACVAVFIPSVPKWVQQQMAIESFDEQNEIRKQRLLKAQKKKEVVFGAYKRRNSEDS